MPSLRATAIRRGFVAALKVQRRLMGEVDPTAPEEELEAFALRLRAQLEQIGRYVRLPGWADWRADGDSPVYTEWVASDRSEHDRVILHLHGGAFMMGSPRTHRGMAASLAKTARARVAVPDYRLAPEHPFPAALDDAVATYRWLIEDHGVDPRRLAVTGDSAGGGLAVSMLVRVRDVGLPLPAAYAGMSPWTDLAGTGETMRTMAAVDPWLRAELVAPTARGYAGERALEDPEVSCLYADLTGLPPMLVHAGTEEILLDDARRLVERARAAGVTADLGVFDGLWHVFQAFPAVPEARSSLREIGAFIRRHTSQRATHADARDADGAAA